MHTLTDWHGPECSPRDVSLPPQFSVDFYRLSAGTSSHLQNFTGFPIWNSRSQQWDLPHQPQSCSGNATLKRKFQVPCIIKIYFNKLHSSWQPACWSQRAENQHKMPQTEMHDIQTCSATTFSTSTGRTLGWPYQHIPLPSILHWCGIN